MDGVTSRASSPMFDATWYSRSGSNVAASDWLIGYDALVILGGDLASAGEPLLEPLRQAISRDAIEPAAGRLKVDHGAP